MTVAVVDTATPCARKAGTADAVPPSMVERMTLIIDIFDRRTTRLSLEEVTARTRLPRSTAHRILDQLVKLHWLDHSARGYALGRRALRLSGDDGMLGEIRRAAAPHLHELHMRTGLVVHLGALDGSDELILDKIGGRFAAAPAARVGGRNPAILTARGRAILAWLDPERVDTLLLDRPSRPGAAGRWTLAALHHELDRIRRHRGLATERAEGAAFTGVAMAVCGPEGPLAAISVCPEQRPVPLERAVPTLAEAVRRTTSDLFPPKPRGVTDPAV